MEPTSETDEGHLSASICERRRSSSMSDDYSVQKTNDDASECKWSAVQLKYWSDEFLARFVQRRSNPVHTPRRDPEISRGYWARVVAVRSLVDHFIQKAGPSCQIVNLGAGFDTLFWRLKASGAGFSRYVEVDFSSVTAKKLRLILKPGTPNLVEYFTQPPRESSHTDLHAGDFHLVGADLRQSGELEAKLLECDIDPTKPTLCIAECVLVYMSAAQSAQLVRNFAQFFTSIAFVNYEQVCMNDAFGKVMEKNLIARGISLPGLSVCENLDSQKARFASNGYTQVSAWLLSDIYANLMCKEEVQRIERIELLDERELLTQLLDHYCLVYARANLPDDDDLQQHSLLSGMKLESV